MDDSAQDQVQSSVQDDARLGGVMASQAKPAQPATTRGVSPSDQTGAGSVHKEQGPAVYQEPVEKVEEEYLKPSEVESLPKEVQEAGVEITQKHEAVSFAKPTGIEPAKESTPLPTFPSSNVKLPPEKEVLKILKTTSVKDSKHWMAFLIEKIYEQFRTMKSKVKI